MKDDDSALIADILDSAEPSSHYYVLLVLSTLIASFGLIAGSTATVIGAMIVAPLMGPILGLSLSSLRGEFRSFYKALGAEWTGVGLCIAVGALVAFIIHPENIDYTGKEIAARLRPTLIDLGIGVFAGWAGAYSAWRSPRGSGAAGVAVAVALVPPLAVTGLCLAGAASGHVPWGFVWSSFVLFLANFLTIELSSTAVFAWAGLGSPKHLLESFKAHTLILSLLLILTAGFLYKQLNLLITEHRLRTTVDQELRHQVAFMPGCALDTFELKLTTKKLNILAVMNVDRELRPEAVIRMENAIRSALANELEVHLILRTVKSRLLSSEGVYRFGAKKKNKSVESVGFALQDMLDYFPGFELQSYEIRENDSKNLDILASMRGPKTGLTKLEVRFMEKVLLYLLHQKGSEVQSLSLEVKWSSEQIQTSTQTAGAEEPPGASKRLRLLEQRINEELSVVLKEEGLGKRFFGCYIVEERFFRSKQEAQSIRAVSAQLLIRGADDIKLENIQGWEKLLSKKLSGDEILAPILSASSPEDENPDSLLFSEFLPGLEQQFKALCEEKDGRSSGVVRLTILKSAQGPERGRVAIQAVAYTPEALSGEEIESWRMELQTYLDRQGLDYSVSLKLRNSIGRFVDAEGS